MDRRYDPHAIEKKWQRHWKERDLFRTPDESDKPKFYGLDFFPYPAAPGCRSATAATTSPPMSSAAIGG